RMYFLKRFYVTCRRAGMLDLDMIGRFKLLFIDGEFWLELRRAYGCELEGGRHDLRFLCIAGGKGVAGSAWRGSGFGESGDGKGQDKGGIRGECAEPGA